MAWTKDKNRRRHELLDLAIDQGRLSDLEQAEADLLDMELCEARGVSMGESIDAAKELFERLASHVVTKMDARDEIYKKHCNRHWYEAQRSDFEKLGSS